MTKSPIVKFIQLAFFHSFKKTSILKSDAEYFALSGFNERATAVRVDPIQIFKQSRSKLRVPTFDEIMKMSMKEEIMDLKPSATMEEEKLDIRALISPQIFKDLVDLEDLSASNVLVKIILNISLQKTSLATTAQIEDDEYIDVNNMELDREDLTNDNQQTGTEEIDMKMKKNMGK